MRSNIVRFMDYHAEDALARLTEQAWQERRAEALAEQRRAERQRLRRLRWVVNLAMIVMIALAAFAAGLCAGCL